MVPVSDFSLAETQRGGQSQMLLTRAGLLIDGKGGALKNRPILVEVKRIVGVGAEEEPQIPQTRESSVRRIEP